MSEKVVSVVIQAKVDGAVAGFKKAKAAVDDLTKAASPSKADAFGKLADKAALAGVGIATAVGLAVKRFADFDQAMSAVQANSGATGASLDALRAQAVKLGADSQFSATEAAQGINELAKAGVDAKDVLGGGLKGSLDLAAAGQISVADAAETAATAMTQFKLSGDKVPHIADLLANAANKAQGGVGDMGMALKQAGLVAASTGLSIEETTAGLTAFASAGLIGSDAGTSFKTMLQRLSNPADDAKALMEELNISAYDTQGNFIGLANVAGQLQKALKDKSEEERASIQATIFGSDAVRASNVLYQEGADGIRKWTAEVSESGAAAKQAATLTDNLKGDIERLGGALDSVFIQTGSGANGSLRGLTQGVTGLVEVVGRVPAPMLLAGAGITALALVVPKGVIAFRNYKAQLDATGLSLDKVSAKAPRAARALDVATKASLALAAVAAAGAVAQSFQDQAAGANEATKSLEAYIDRGKESKAVTDIMREGFGSLDQQVSILNVDGLGKLGQSLDNAASGFGIFGKSLSDTSADFFKEVDTGLSGLVSSGRVEQAAGVFEKVTESAKRQGVSIDQVKDALPGYEAALSGIGPAAQSSVKGSGKMTDATGDLQGAAEKAQTALDNLKAAIEGLGSPVAQQRDAENAYEAAIDNVTKGLGDQKDALVKSRLEALGITDATKKQQAAAEAWATAQMKSTDLLDKGTDAGRDNRRNLDEIAAATKTKVAADFALNESSKGTVAATDIATKSMKDGRDAYIAAAIEAGKTATQAGVLADQLGLIPEQVAIQVSQTGAEGAGAAIDAAARDRAATIWVTRKETDGLGSELGAGRRRTDLSSTFKGVGGRADGGFVPGHSPHARADNIPIYATAGEFMLRKASADSLGEATLHYLNRYGRLPARHADGGTVMAPYAPRGGVMPSFTMLPSSISETNNSPINIAQVVTNDWAKLERDAESRRRLAALGRRRARG